MTDVVKNSISKTEAIVEATAKAVEKAAKIAVEYAEMNMKKSQLRTTTSDTPFIISGVLKATNNAFQGQKSLKFKAAEEKLAAMEQGTKEEALEAKIIREFLAEFTTIPQPSTQLRVTVDKEFNAQIVKSLNPLFESTVGKTIEEMEKAVKDKKEKEKKANVKQALANC